MAATVACVVVAALGDGAAEGCDVRVVVVEQGSLVAEKQGFRGDFAA